MRLRSLLLLGTIAHGALLGGQAEAQPIDYRNLPPCSGLNQALNYNASTETLGCTVSGSAGGAATYYTLNLGGGTGVVPPGTQQYPANYASTFALMNSGNMTLANPAPWGWANQRVGLCMIQGFSAAASWPLCPPNGGLNWNGASDFAGYPSIDDVQMAMIETSLAPIASPTGTFTATTFTPSSPFTPTSPLQVNMQVETGGASPWRSFITAWTVNGAGAVTGLTVAGWYQSGNSTAGQIPSGTTSLYINPADRTWNINTISQLAAAGFATQATGIELDMDNAKNASPQPLDVLGILVGGGSNGASSVNKYDISSAFAAQGGSWAGFQSRSGHNAFFLAYPDTNTGSYNAGFLTYQTTGAGFQAFDGSNGFKFSASAVDGSLDLGAYGGSSSPTNQMPAITWHAAGGTVDSLGNGEAQIKAFGGTAGSAATAAMYIDAGDIKLRPAGAVALEVYGGAGKVDWVNVTGATSGNAPAIGVQGSDTNIALELLSKGTGGLLFATGGGFQAEVTNTVSAVNYVNLTGAATTQAPAISAAGTDTNVSLTLAAKGTGSVQVASPEMVSGGTVSLTNGTSNFLLFPATGQANPSLTTRSVGTRIVLYPSESGTLTDYGFGMNAGVLWAEVASNTASFAWYAGTTQVATLSGGGNFSTTGLQIPASYTVATLPTCNVSTKGALATATDASGTLTFLGALTGGGSTVAPAFCNGTSWVAG